ncbi:E3 ubiquitin-protein ligase NEURL1B-like [Lytechinus variegatus]|uniref:E3 ubiquitin-protein ligase NEURL1B-like n=1 Tax=Lytechinus variegatus TaxID=7654 RepID=UPI001BB15948|nr:E3 ubiquitin-protein ligase NEURL1B-like [Lytechinus variegatus]
MSLFFYTGVNGGSSNVDSHANDRRRVTFGAPAVPLRPKSPNAAGISARQSWPNIHQPPDTGPITPNEIGGSETAGPSSRLPNHLFHTTHGKNIVLSPNRKLATRGGSFCNAIVFTHRPLRPQDRLHLQLIQSTQGWSGVIRFGFSCHCPDRLKPHMLPKYACPDLTVKPGYWVKALRETLAANGNVLSFFVNSRGEVYYSINGEPYHMFFNGVDVSKPLWALIDVYGNTTGIRIVDEHTVANNAFNLPPTAGYEAVGRGPSSSASSQSLPPTINPALSENISSNIPMTLSGPVPPLPPLPPLPPQMAQQPLLERLPFHSVHGSNIVFSEGLMSAERKADVFNGGLVFVCRSLKVDEAVFICIKTVNHRFIGHLGIGLTTCDPKGLRDTAIPDDAEHVYDRPEYWVLTREFEQPAANDVMGVVFNSEGEVHLLKADGSSRCCLMFVDVTIPLWLYFDVYGTTQAIQTIGYRNISIPCTGMTETTAESNTTNLNTVVASESAAAVNAEALAYRLAASFLSSSSSAPAITGTAASSKPKPPRPSKPPTRSAKANPSTSSMYPQASSQGSSASEPSAAAEAEECSICFEAPVNSVFYKCGHTCCCFECANKMRGSCCPICRAVIADVIRMYKP